MKASTWWIIGAILFSLIVHNEVVSWLILLVLVVPPLLKLLGWAYDAETGAYRDKYTD